VTDRAATDRNAPVPYRLVDRPEELPEALAPFAGAPEIAVDLEADGLHSYREKVCLVQLSSRQRTLIIDPLACRGRLEAFGALLADPAVRTVFHGGDFDVRLLKRDFGFAVRGLFDTMIAARFCGRERFGLAALLEESFGVLLDKRHQQADWSARPLTPDRLAYAAADTAHLLPLADLLAAELARRGRTGWAAEECALLEAVEPAAPRPPWCLDVKGAAALAPPQLAVLQQLLEVRDAEARRQDRPPFKVLPNQILLAWAAVPPGGVAEVLGAHGVDRRRIAALAPEILAAVGRARSLPPEAWPQPEARRADRLSDPQQAILRRLRDARERVERALGLPAGMVVNTATLTQIARLDREAALGFLADGLKRWQREAIGGELAAALADGAAAGAPAQPELPLTP
jgi:ribonuclease D